MRAFAAALVLFVGIPFSSTAMVLSERLLGWPEPAAVGRHFRFALAAGIERRTTMARAERAQLRAPDRRRHRPAGHERQYGRLCRNARRRCFQHVQANAVGSAESVIDDG